MKTNKQLTIINSFNLESIRLSKLLKQPYDLYHPGVIDSYLLGLINQRAGRMDPALSTEVTNHLFEKPGKLFGIDLAAINIQRGRDMGVPGYNHFRDYCGLPRAKYFEDLTGVFSNKTLLRLSQLYKHVDDIDLWTAGISEYPIQDGLVGPTFACLIARQFVNLRRGDRFWYENDGYPAQFTIEQLDEIRKSTAARLLCDNSDDIETIQASAMLVADPYSNPRVHCSSLPYIDLSKWKEYTAQVNYGKIVPQQQQYPQALGNNHDEYNANNHLAQASPLAYDSQDLPLPIPQPPHYPSSPPSSLSPPLPPQIHRQPAMPIEMSIPELASRPEALEDYESTRSQMHIQVPKQHQQQHFVDHVIDSKNYKLESRSYQQQETGAVELL